MTRSGGPVRRGDAAAARGAPGRLLHISGLTTRRGLIVAIPALWSATAAAQVGDGLLTPPAIPRGFDRGRNISVSERQRSDFDPLGITVRSFIVAPVVELGVGATSNSYNQTSNPRSAPIAYVAPSVSAASQWSRHQLRLRAATRLTRFIGESARNENIWDVGAGGRVDLGSYLTIAPDLSASRTVESFFSGDVAANVAALSRVRTDYGALRATYTGGRSRAILSVDRANTRFSTIRFQDGTERDQSGRDRDVTRVTAQLDYARTPSVSVFAQLGYGHNEFLRPLVAGQSDRDSNGYRALVGLNLDVTGRARGSIGAGYSYRKFEASQYRSVSGLSVEAELELFPTELTTYTLSARRSIEDSSFNNGNPFFDNRITAQVDRELRRNLIGTVSASYTRQQYRDGTVSNTDGYQIAGAARYLSTRRFRLELSARYSDRSTQGVTAGNRVSELRGQFGIVLQR